MYSDSSVTSLKCEEWKNKGNAAFQKKDYQLAVEYYSEALKFDRTDHRVYSNRSFALFYNNDFKRSAADALIVVRLQPKWAKVRCTFLSNSIDPLFLQAIIASFQSLSSN